MSSTSVTTRIVPAPASAPAIVSGAAVAAAAAGAASPAIVGSSADRPSWGLGVPAAGALVGAGAASRDAGR